MNQALSMEEWRLVWVDQVQPPPWITLFKGRVPEEKSVVVEGPTSPNRGVHHCFPGA